MSSAMYPVDKVGDEWVVDDDFSILESDDIPRLEDGIENLPTTRGTVRGKEVTIWVAASSAELGRSGYALCSEVGP